MARDETKCVLCKKGVYRLFADTDSAGGRAVCYNAGFRPSGSRRLVIKRCDHCGHLVILKP